MWHTAVVCMLYQHVAPKVDIFDFHSTQGALLEVMILVYVFLKMHFALEFLPAYVTSHLLLQMIVLDMLKVVSFGSFPSANVTHCFEPIISLLLHFRK